MHHKLSCDFLVVGAGAMGLAFVDELRTRRPDAEIILVDRRAKPGGHWNDAYRYVSLHQPAAFYGVNSMKLGPGGAALASGSEVLTYYEQVLERLLASGRVRYYSQCESSGDGAFSSLISGDTYEVEVAEKTVDATYMNVEVPSTSPPKYAVSDEVAVIAPNGLPRLASPASEYVVIGAGKTGMDAVLFLLAQGVAPDAVTWIMSNDAWLLNRSTLTPGRTVGWFTGQFQMIAGSSTLEEVFHSAEEAGSFLRLDTEVWPTKFRCATVNRQEIEAMRRVENVVRLGRVKSVEPQRLVLDGGELETAADAVYVDCTADGLAKRPVVPVFSGSKITLQSVFMCQQVFSAALLAYVECKFGSDDQKNALCDPVPHPEFNLDYFTAMATSSRNFDRWGRTMFGWLRKSRLSLTHHSSLPSTLINSYKTKRIMPVAMASMERILRAGGAPEA